jgi:alpha-glucosidase
VTAPWWEGSVLYQVYPRAFADSNGDQVGDLPGITNRLGHVAGRPDALGVDGIWLSPFYPHGGVDGGYDVTDFTGVSPEYGRLADVDRLLAASHAAGARLLVDLVVGHTSDRHPWFTASRSSRSDAHRTWYLWADGRPDGGPPTNWVAEFGGPAWTRDPATGQWYHHSFYPGQPDLNWRNPAVREAMAEVMRFWLDRGADGFRVDAIQYVIKDDRLRDNPPARRSSSLWGAEPGGLRRKWSRDQASVVEVIRALRRVTDAYPGAVLLGELYAPAERLATAYGGPARDGFQLALAHQIAKSEWDAGAFRRAISAAERYLAPPLAPTWAFSNHDQPRHATRWGIERARLAALILLTLRGTVSLYQGEELGAVDDPRPGPWSTNDPFGRDPARAPIDWAEAERQRRDPGSVLALYRALIAERRRSPALRRGTLQLLTGLPSGVLGYERTAGRERRTVLANMGSRRARIPWAGRSPNAVLTTEPDGEIRFENGRIVLEPDTGVLIRST